MLLLLAADEFCCFHFTSFVGEYRRFNLTDSCVVRRITFLLLKLIMYGYR